MLSVASACAIGGAAAGVAVACVAGTARWCAVLCINVSPACTACPPTLRTCRRPAPDIWQLLRVLIHRP